MKKSKQCRDLWDNIKWTNISTARVQEREDRIKEKLYEATVDEIFPNLMKVRNMKIQRTLWKINKTILMPRNMKDPVTIESDGEFEAE